MSKSNLFFHCIKLPLPFSLNHINAYLLKDNSGWCMIDTGLGTVATELEWQQALARLHIRFEDITRIIITHFHPDHIGFAGGLQRLTQAPVLMTETTKKLAHSHFFSKPSKKSFYNLIQNGIPEHLVSEIEETNNRLIKQVVNLDWEKVFFIEDEEILSIGNKYFKVIQGDGHAEGSIGLLDEDSGSFIAGDMLLEGITPNITHDFTSTRNPLRLYFHTLERLKQLPIHQVLPGHGIPFELSLEHIPHVIAHHNDRLQRLLELFKEMPSKAITPYEACRKLFTRSLNSHDMQFAIGETNAHLYELEQQGLLRLIDQSPRTYVYS